MILLQATRVDIHGRFEYRIDTPDGARIMASNAEAAAGELRQLGVADPERLVAHVENWGTIEIRTKVSSVYQR
jgi:hypothetical protein